ncbi:hypothetical protein [Mycolicibacterium mengxianglii]|uniref:hypothetical protein n=1 Tax=Mycolicibacterium mengxianglii TaxID=2736649 RepID=UPI0018EEFEE3|nr:hypothetical protein [Mycolicibacterium mengxianglii]
MSDTENTDGEVTEDGTEDTETFPREYVEQLRRENANYRERARTAESRADERERALHLAKVAATGKLADPTDLPFRPEHLDDDDTLTAAVDALLEDKPHLRARKASGDIGQGQLGKDAGPVNFSTLFR